MDVLVLGSLNVDVVTRVAKLPAPGETIIGLGLDTFPGGKGLNQAVAAARLGASVALLGATGVDEGGAMLRAVLREAGVDQEGVLSLATHSTGQAHICVAADGENTIVVTPGANAAIGADTVASQPPARVLLCQFETPHAALARFLANGEGAVRIVNAAPSQPDRHDLFDLAEIVVVNETELERYAGSAVDPTDLGGVLAAARHLMSRPDQTVIVTLGKQGCIAVTSARDMQLPGVPADVVDTTGAGDCFCGALAAGLASGMTLEDALAFANRAAALAVERPGAASGMPTLAALRARFHGVSADLR